MQDINKGVDDFCPGGGRNKTLEVSIPSRLDASPGRGSGFVSWSRNPPHRRIGPPKSRVCFKLPPSGGKMKYMLDQLEGVFAIFPCDI